MSIYLVDYENTQNLAGIKNLTSDDRVIVFYSSNANSMSFDVHMEILSSTATIEYKNVDVGGQNALDFQLATYLGYLIKQNENSQTDFYIVSKDKGFAYLVKFWQKETAIDIRIISDLKGKTQAREKSEVEQDDSIEMRLKQSDLELSEDEIKEILGMVSRYKTTQTINGYLNKLFKDSTKAGAVLKLIKPFIKK